MMRTALRVQAAVLLAAASALMAGVADPVLAASSGPSAGAATTTTGCGQPAQLQSSDFPASPTVDNRFFPLSPGTEWALTGTVAGKRHTVVTDVTDLTKTVDGVRTIVVLDRDFDSSTLAEAELALFAQAKSGRIFGIGEYPEEYAKGKLVGAPDTWMSGIAHAHAGIAMRAQPRVGTPAYLQGLSRGISFLDCARVLRNGQRTCVPTGCYLGVLVTDEWGPLDPTSGHQRKFYAPGVGLIHVGAVGGNQPEVLSLTRHIQLCPSDLASIRGIAATMDARGPLVSPDVYAHTTPAQQTLHAAPC
jgi:hypothetical protein